MPLTEDDRIEQGWSAALSPTHAQTARVERKLEPIFDAPAQSLAAEWFELLRLRPLLHGVLAGACAFGAAMLSPAAVVIALLASFASAGR